MRLIHGEALATLQTLPEASTDACVTDPPYEFGFMGKRWDATGVAFRPETWAAVLRVMKPGAYLLAFGGSRTYHRLTCAVEDAGFEVRDCLLWLYGTGFPKGQGCLKPAYEPILLARKPGRRVLPLGIDECRIPCEGGSPSQIRRAAARKSGNSPGRPGEYRDTIEDRTSPERYMAEREAEALGRYPANVLHDGSDEVMGAFAAFGSRMHGAGVAVDRGTLNHANEDDGVIYGSGLGESAFRYGDSGTAARFFYCAKASKAERGEGNNHPTVKPLALVQWLTRLVTPHGSTVLDPFMGSGTTGFACVREGRDFIGIEQEAAYCEIARRRIAEVEANRDGTAGELFSQSPPS